MRIKDFSLVCIFFIRALATVAQPDTDPAVSRAKVGIFIPLYLDSVFTGSGSYKFNNSIPKYVMPGLEFYSGVQMALDSLSKDGLHAEVFLVDSKDRYRSLNGHIQDLQNVSLLIGMVQNVNELKLLADAARLKNISFISATYPNDGGITGNPSLVILNATLKTHCQGIYNLLATNYKNDRIIILSKPGVQEDKMKAVYEESNRNRKPALAWKTRDIGEGISQEELAGMMDSTRNNVIVCASFDESMGTSVVKQLSNLRNPYRSTVIGMPTWDDIKFDSPDFKSVEILYSTPFLTSSGNNRAYNSVTNKFKARSHSRPSDMVYKGFEITYRYIRNMLSHQDNIIDLSDHAGKIFSDFDIQPVKMRTSKNEPDYYENKKVYFIRKMDGVVKGLF